MYEKNKLFFVVANAQRGSVEDFGGSEASFLRQAITLTQRSFANMWRDFGYYWLRLAIYIVVTICIGTIYFDIGTSYNAIQVNYSLNFKL